MAELGGTVLAGGVSKSENDEANARAAEFAISALNAGHEQRNSLGVPQGSLTLIKLKEASSQVSLISQNLLKLMNQAYDYVQGMGTAKLQPWWVEGHVSSTHASPWHKATEHGFKPMPSQLVASFRAIILA